MVEPGTASEISKLSIQLSAVFAVIGVGLLYACIAIASAPDTIKVLWASGLSLAVALTFLIIWTIAGDMAREGDRMARRKTMP